jgi:hypothetical protein
MTLSSLSYVVITLSTFKGQLLLYGLAVINTSHLYFRGHAVAQVLEALRYKPEGCEFDSR